MPTPKGKGVSKICRPFLISPSGRPSTPQVKNTAVIIGVVVAVVIVILLLILAVFVIVVLYMRCKNTSESQS